MAPRITSAPTIPQNSTRCWYMPGTAKKPNSIAITKMLSTASVKTSNVLEVTKMLHRRALRSLLDWLGEPLAIPLHRLQSGALLLFTFFMISDPRTTPDSRAGRIVFAALVAFGAWYVQFRLFRTNGLLWSLAAFSLATPLLDWLLPGSRYRWLANREAHRSQAIQHSTAV